MVASGARVEEGGGSEGEEKMFYMSKGGGTKENVCEGWRDLRPVLDQE